MAFPFYCPQGHLLQGEPEQAGQPCQCPQCGSTFLVPQAAVAGGDLAMPAFDIPPPGSNVCAKWGWRPGHARFSDPAARAECCPASPRRLRHAGLPDSAAGRAAPAMTAYSAPKAPQRREVLPPKPAANPIPRRSPARASSRAANAAAATPGGTAFANGSKGIGYAAAAHDGRTAGGPLAAAPGPGTRGGELRRAGL